MNIGDVVVIGRALGRGRFIVTGFRSMDRRTYAKLQHEREPWQNGHVLTTALIPATDAPFVA